MANILLAEDDESLRRFLAAALERAGHAVTSFGDGAAAYECLRGGGFELLLSDIVMPGLDGIELAKRGADLHPTLKTVHHWFCRGGSASRRGDPKHARRRRSTCASWQEVDRMIAA
jgi:two-component system cell cycle response regulator CpdR